MTSHNSASPAARRMLGAASALAIALIVSAPAYAAGQTARFEIPSQSLSEALAEFSRQSQVNVIAPSSLTRGKVSKAVSGEMERDEALRTLIGDASFEIRPVDDGSFILAQNAADAQKGRPFRAAQVAARKAEPEVKESTAAGTSDSDVIVVTGTNIRGISPDSSPAQTYSREDILKSGVTSTEQFIRTLPQNFGGGSSEFTGGGLPNDANATLNYSYGTGANLRGLGSGGTLVLLNGNRLAPTSTIGNFVDLSMIPVSALARVDVLTDGASSVYGSDAVSGVINFVLRDDYEGSETAFRYGAVTDGPMEEYRATQALGAAWESGNILGAYEHFSRDNLSLADRPGIDAPELSGGGLITAREQFDLLPEQRRHSGVVSLNQEIAPALEFSASGLYSNRIVDHRGVNSIGAGAFVDTHAASAGLVVHGGLDYDISDRWSVSAGGAYSHMRNRQSRAVSTRPDQARFSFDSDLRTLDLVVNGGLFELPGGESKIAVGGQFRSESFIYTDRNNGEVGRDGDREIVSAFGEVFLPIIGSDSARPGVERFEINLSGRIDDYSDFGSTVNPKFGVLWAPVEDLRLRGSYSTSFAPPPLGRVGDRQTSGAVLPTSVAAAIVGLGGQYPALDGTNYLLLTGVSDNLAPEKSRTFSAGFEYGEGSQRNTFLISFNYYDIRFEDRLGRVPIPGNVDVAFAPFLALDDPSLFPEGTVIFFPPPGDVDALVSSFNIPIQFLAGGALENVGVINNANIIRNLAQTKTNGLDLQLDYSAQMRFGEFSAGLNANYIINFKQQAAVTTPKVDVLNVLYNPVDLQLRGHLGYSHGGLSANAYVNYTDSYQSDGTPNAAPIDSWTTIDLTLSYGLSENSGAWLEGTAFNISVQNLFNEAPPSTPTLGQFQLAGYDPTNASPVGRFLAFEIRKSF